MFFSNQGSQGKLGEASQQQLENIFGTHHEIDVAQKILENGQIQAGGSFSDDKKAIGFNRGGYQMDVRGSGTTTKGV